MEFRSDHVPVIAKAISSLVDMPINRYTSDTPTLLGLQVEAWKRELRDSTRSADSPFTQDAAIYYINASLLEIPDTDERVALMRIHTTLYLTDEQIDRLLSVASELINSQTSNDYCRILRPASDENTPMEVLSC